MHKNSGVRKVAQAGDVMLLDEKNPHIRNNRDGTVIKLDVNNGVYTMDMWGQRAARVSQNKPVRPRTNRRSESEECYAEQAELNGLEEGRGLDDGRRRRRRSSNSRLDSASRPKKQTDCKRKGRARSNTHAIPRLVHTLHDGQRSHSSPRVEEKE